MVVRRVWSAFGGGVGLLLVIGFISLQSQAADAEVRVELVFGVQLVAWTALAITYLVQGVVRAFSGCDRGELVRRVEGGPQPGSRVKRWLLAGGGGQGWAVVIAVGAFGSMVTAVVGPVDDDPACARPRQSDGLSPCSSSPSALPQGMTSRRVG